MSASLPGTFAELLAGFSDEQIARMEEFADSALPRSPRQERFLVGAFAGAGERWLSAQAHQSAA